MKLRWWVVGIAAVAAGSILMIKHLVEDKKTSLSFIDNNNEESFGRFPYKIHDTEFADSDFLE